MTGRHVLVTGGSSGIGKAVARRYAAAGDRVTIIARRQDVLASAAHELAPVGAVRAIVADVADRAALAAAITDAVAGSGPVDVLVCCAGNAHPGYFGELTDAAFDEAMDVNYFGTLHAVRAVLGPMRARGSGHLVLVASGGAIIGLFGYGAYGPSKFAVRGLAETLRAELAGTGVGVSVVYLPDVDTPMLVTENRTKPPELAAIAGTAKAWSADAAARLIVRGVERRRFTIAGSVAIRAFVHGHSVLAPVLRWYFDRLARKARPKTSVDVATRPPDGRLQSL